jgi:N utilization substance protein B
MGSRRKAREAALQLLYELDVSGNPIESAIDEYFRLLGADADAETRAFAKELVVGCMARVEEIDTKIREISKHWRIERMARVDRNVMRLAVYELLALPDVPRSVTLNEAVELAKRFGDENSPSFVNGVLDRIAGELGKS